MNHPTEEPPRKVCAVCGRVLACITLDGISNYAHELQDQPSDHLSVPVDPDDAPEQARFRCDFCNLDTAREVWRVPTRTFRLPLPIGGSYSQGDWAACNLCALLINADRWETLLNRAVTSARVKNPGVPEATVRVGLTMLYEMVRANITGPMVRA